MNRRKKHLRIAAVAVAVVMMTAGCGNGGISKQSTGGNYLNAEYPIKTKEKLTFWCPMNASCNSYGTNLAETPLFKELAKETGIKVEFKHPPTGQSSEQFNLLIASGEMPDLVQYNFLSYLGGPDKAIKENIISEISSLIEQGYAPNFKKLIDENKDLRKMVSTDSGKFYAFPFIRGDESLMTYNGPILRKDWLDELGLQVPETIDEWENVLKAFKDKKGAESPLIMQNMVSLLSTVPAFVGAYGIRDGFYVEDDKIHYGPIEDGYKQYLTTIRKWFVEGLLDKDFATTDKSAVDSKMLMGKAGATIGMAGSSMGNYLSVKQKDDPKYDLVAAPYPVLQKGTTPKFGQYTGAVSHGYDVAISAKSNSKELAARLMDYGYSEKGKMLFNFGIEGESYEMKDGYPTYTEKITKNPDGLTMNQAMGGYMQSQYGGSFVQDVRYMEQYFSYKQQQDAINTWKKTDEVSYHMPDVTATEDEAGELVSIMNAVDTYKNEMVANYIMGQASLDDFDSFISQIKALNIDRAIEINQSAYDRYSMR